MTSVMPMRDRPADIWHELPERHNIRTLDVVCTHCGARNFSCERSHERLNHFSTYCNNDQIAVTGNCVFGQSLELLIRLLIDDSQVARYFRKEIRRYNTLAFVAFSTDLNSQMKSIGSPNADPMLYPLFFPYGENRWHYNLLQEGNRRKAVCVRNTIREFVCYRLTIWYTGSNSQGYEGNVFSLLHAGGFLLQQYVCDQYVRMEANNLWYTRDNQKMLFAEAYQGLVDHINRQLHVDEINSVGRRMILPSSFVSGPRYMK